jgi:hypothetical protein
MGDLYRKKPVVIEARRLQTRTATSIAQWCGGSTYNEAPGGCPDILIDTLEGTMEAKRGDWVIKGVANEFYPVKPDIFDRTYEKVDE